MLEKNNIYLQVYITQTMFGSIWPGSESEGKRQESQVYTIYFLENVRQSFSYSLPPRLTPIYSHTLNPMHVVITRAHTLFLTTTPVQEMQILIGLWLELWYWDTQLSIEQHEQQRERDDSPGGSGAPPPSQ